MNCEGCSGVADWAAASCAPTMSWGPSGRRLNSLPRRARRRAKAGPWAVTGTRAVPWEEVAAAAAAAAAATAVRCMHAQRHAHMMWRLACTSTATADAVGTRAKRAVRHLQRPSVSEQMGRGMTAVRSVCAPRAATACRCAHSIGGARVGKSAAEVGGRPGDAWPQPVCLCCVDWSCMRVVRAGTGQPASILAPGAGRRRYHPMLCAFRASCDVGGGALPDLGEHRSHACSRLLDRCHGALARRLGTQQLEPLRVPGGPRPMALQHVRAYTCVTRRRRARRYPHCGACAAPPPHLSWPALFHWFLSHRFAGGRCMWRYRLHPHLPRNLLRPSSSRTA